MANRYAKIGKRLQKVRLAAGLSQVEFADSIKVEKSQWHRWEHGSRCIPVAHAMKICEQRGVTLDFIYRGVGE